MPVEKQPEPSPQAGSTQDEIASLRARVERAWASADRARQGGTQEQQIESFCLAEALELQLGRLRNGQDAARG